MPAVLGHEQSGRLPLDRGSDEDRARLGGALDARGDIGRVAEYLTSRVDHHLTGIKADPRLKFWDAFAGVSGVDFDKRALDRERGAHSALSIVLLRVRIAEQRHQPVAEFFQNVAAKPGHRRRSFIEIGVDERAPILGVELRSHACGPDEVTEHDCDRAALGGRRRRHRGGARRLGGGFPGPESGDRPEETLAVPQRHADLFEVGFDQVAEDARVDLMHAEHGFVLSEVDRVQPLGDVHRRSRIRFDSDDGPRETASPGRELWPAPMESNSTDRTLAGNDHHLRTAGDWNRWIVFSNAAAKPRTRQSSYAR